MKNLKIESINRLFQLLTCTIFLLFIPASFAQGQWVQQGADIDGEVAGDQSGFSVSMSSDGSTVAIGAHLNDGNGQNSGHIRVYKYNGTSWIQQGADIDGEAAGDYSGYSVSISSDGLTVAIGAYLNDGNGGGAGHVRVYKYNGTSWVQQGADIDGDVTGDYSGRSVSISLDGLTVAIGANGNDGNGFNAGHVRVYKYNGTSWIQQGVDIDGEASNDESGSSVSISSDGLIVAIGAYLNDGNGQNSGHVRVYKYNGTSWVQQGADIDGEAADDQSGCSVSISSDGLTVAIGANGNDGNGQNSGHVRVYKYNGTSWVQQGADIGGEAAYDYSGSSVSISSDGLTVGIGARNNNGGGQNSGHVRVYKYNGTSWVQQGADIDGEAAGDQSGFSVSISSDGSIVAIGAYLNDGNGQNSGHVRVYLKCTVNTSVIVSLPTLTANVIGANYQWLDCNNNYAAISGEIGQSFTATNNGSYAVEVTENGCTDTSSCYMVTGIGISENSPFTDVSIFPNPNNGVVNIDLGSLKNVTVQVFSIGGQLLNQKMNINTPNYQFVFNEAPGIYFIEISTDSKTQRYKLVKQ